ncbi:MAG TPA: hypothetical protein VFH59_15930 [Frateuria sp.]|uniref:hypothetical protein n=1 Tax=Frateuria sp. TaxID=2211372 RepID=UPI002D7F2579|nr:hypothetical protein [Frateuria sp.]HET6806923.1 hypothetical protein [Frateuria sp.]
MGLHDAVAPMTAVIAKHFSASEIAALERGAVDLASISASILVSFHAQRLHRARLAWLNVRWFLQQGIDVLNVSTRRRAEAWLLDEFAYEATLGRGIPSSAFKTFYADRYGSTEGTTPHGGSGRSGIAGRFSAKGIGQTPLVGEDAHPGHAHGHASLEECLREAVYSEVFDAEFPAGALPVIAVLDAGCDYVDPDLRSARAIRRGLLIRPCTLRPAHIERAPLFRPLGASESDTRAHQLEDVARAKAAVRYWLTVGPPGGAAACLKQLVARLVDQIAFGQVHRLTGGGVFSSNVSVWGQLLDFGNAHYFPDWARAKILDHAAGFGEELTTLRAVIKSLVFFFNKYGPNGRRPLRETEWQDYAASCYENAFVRECSLLFNAQQANSPQALSLAALFQAHFKERQRHCTRYQYGLIDGQGRRTFASDFIAQHKPVLDRLLADVFKTKSDTEHYVAGAYATMCRYLGPRTEIDRGRLTAVLTDHASKAAESIGEIAPHLEALVNGIVGASRRHWPLLPNHLVVHAQKAYGASCVLLCEDARTSEPVLWLEGMHHDGRLCLFDQWLADDVRQFTLRSHGNKRWCAAIRAVELQTGCAAKEIAAVVNAAPAELLSFSSGVDFRRWRIVERQNPCTKA